MELPLPTPHGSQLLASTPTEQESCQNDRNFKKGGKDRD